MKIPFTKAHGARNDFLLTWRDQLPAGLDDIAGVAVAICDRHTGVGADGWLLLSRGTEGKENAAIELWNSDGSRSEISGNGTRCAAALLVESKAAGTDVRIGTGAGLKHLRLLARDGRRFTFEMNMGAASIEELHASIEGRDCTILNVGNPQCVFLSTISISNGRLWARASSAIRGFRTAPMFPSCAWWMATPWTSVFLNAARGKP